MPSRTSNLLIGWILCQPVIADKLPRALSVREDRLEAALKEFVGIGKSEDVEIYIGKVPVPHLGWKIFFTEEWPHKQTLARDAEKIFFQIER